jgi:GTP cyclohydrolase I
MEIDNAKSQDMERQIRDLLSNFDDVNREGLIDTPARWVRAMKELLISKPPRIAVFDAKGYSQMITEKGIEFYSLCEHHVLPFFGTVTVSYVPKGKIIGLSKLSRMVTHFSRRLNTQEYMTENIANFLEDCLDPAGVGVLIRGRHMCKEMRGAKQKGEMVTTALRGIFLTPETRAEFMAGA